jgi:alkanesulfonate monooxygenase SsuD/methylene tetrahydromethanopterin reductase-like flavin-dependent oxidoreductase (luciferase family)
MNVWVFDQFYWPRPGEDRLLYPFPGSRWDPKVGLEQYRDHLQYLQRADEVGFDGVCLTEHHFTVHGLPSPNVMAAAVAAKTSNVKLVLMGNCVPLHAHPVRLAEEIAMLDVLSEGRVVCGLLRGGFMEWYSYGIDGDDARERFEEAWDLIEACWTEPEPFAWNGKHFQYENISITPRPIQQPHPQLAMGASTAESIEWCVKKRIPMASSFAPTESMRENFAYYRQCAKAQFDWAPGPENFMFSRQLYVAPTTKQAREEADEHLIEFFTEIPVARKFPEQIERYRALARTERSFDYKHGKAAGAQFLGASLDVSQGPNLDKLIDDGLVIIGDPDTVTRAILHQRDRLDAATFMMYSPFATLPVSMATSSLELFAKEVLPNLQ